MGTRDVFQSWLEKQVKAMPGLCVQTSASSILVSHSQAGAASAALYIEPDGSDWALSLAGEQIRDTAEACKRARAISELTTLALHINTFNGRAQEGEKRSWQPPKAAPKRNRSPKGINLDEE